MSKIAVMGYCTLCSRKSAGVCQRCRDFYCSPECQKNDWHRHRYICFPMPALVPVELYFDVQSQNGDAIPLLTAEHASEHKTTTTATATTPHSKYIKNTDRTNDQTVMEKSANMQTMKKVPIAKKPEANSKVMVTGFHSPNRCYIRSSNDVDDKIYQSILTQADLYGKNAPPVRDMPALHSYVMTMKNQKWYRGQIIKNLKGLQVLLIDIGISAHRFKNDLRQISTELLELPLYPYMIQLDNVEIHRKSEEFLIKCREFETNEYYVEYKESNGKQISAKLINTANGKTLNDEINSFFQTDKHFGKVPRHNISNISNNFNNSKSDLYNSSMSINSNSNAIEKVEKKSIANLKKHDSSNDNVPLHDIPKPIKPNVPLHDIPKPIKPNAGQPKQVQTPVMNPPFQFRLFDATKENFSVIVMDTSCLEFGYVGALLPSARDNFNQIHELLKNYKFNDLSPYTPKEEEYVVAKYKDDWFRAKVLEVIDNNEYSVVYIDFTNEANVKRDEVRRYPRSLTNDCFTNFCYIEGFPEELDTDTHNKLKVFFNSKKDIIIDRILGKEKNIVHIQCSMITDQLKD